MSLSKLAGSNYFMVVPSTNTIHCLRNETEHCDINMISKSDGKLVSTVQQANEILLFNGCTRPNHCPYCMKDLDQ